MSLPFRSISREVTSCSYTTFILRPRLTFTVIDSCSPLLSAIAQMRVPSLFIAPLPLRASHNTSTTAAIAQALRRHSTFTPSPTVFCPHTACERPQSVIERPVAMLEWLRQMVTRSLASSSPSHAQSLNVVGKTWRHAQLDTPLLPPEGGWTPPLEQASFGLGW